MAHHPHPVRPSPWLPLLPLLLASTLATGLSAAQAAEAAAELPTVPPASAQGVMSFPHVRVERLAPEAVQRLQADKTATAQPAMRAYRDPVTGRLVEPTADGAAVLQAAATAQQPLRRSVFAARMVYPAQGGVGMTLDPSMDSHSVALKGADGRVGVACLPNQANAMAALKRGTLAPPAHKRHPAHAAAAQGELK